MYLKTHAVGRCGLCLRQIVRNPENSLQGRKSCIGFLPILPTYFWLSKTAAATKEAPHFISCEAQKTDDDDSCQQRNQDSHDRNHRGGQ